MGDDQGFVLIYLVEDSNAGHVAETERSTYGASYYCRELKSELARGSIPLHLEVGDAKPAMVGASCQSAV